MDFIRRLYSTVKLYRTVKCCNLTNSDLLVIPSVVKHARVPSTRPYIAPKLANKREREMSAAILRAAIK